MGLRDLRIPKDIQNIIKFKEGSRLIAGELNTNFELLTGVSKQLIENFNIIASEFSTLQTIIAKDTNRKFEIDDVSLARPTLKLFTLDIDPTSINTELTMGLEFIGGGNNTPTPEYLIIDVSTTQTTGDLFADGNFKIGNVGPDLNYYAYYTYTVDLETGIYTYDFYLTPRELDGLDGFYEWSSSQTTIYSNLQKQTNNIKITLNGTIQDNTYNIIPWNLEPNPQTNADNIFAEQTSFDVDAAVEFINNFIDDFTDLQNNVNDINDLIGTEQNGLYKETVIYGTDYTPFGKTSIIRQGMRDVLLFGDITNDTIVDGITGFDVITTLDTRLKLMELGQGAKFGNGSFTTSQTKAINNATDLPFITARDITSDTVQGAITEVDVKIEVGDAQLQGQINTLNEKVDVLENSPDISQVDKVYVDEQIALLQNQITELSNQVATNTTSIATNVTWLNNIDDINDTQNTLINTNTNNIATNTADIATNATNIATNTADIATNTADITTNTTNIATNTSNIANNTLSINNLTTAFLSSVPNQFYGTLTGGPVLEGVWTPLVFTQQKNTFANMTYSGGVFSITSPTSVITAFIKGTGANSGAGKTVTIRLVDNVSGTVVSTSDPTTITTTGQVVFDETISLPIGTYRIEITSTTGAGTITFTDSEIRLLKFGTTREEMSKLVDNMVNELS